MPTISREDATVEFADGDAELRAAQAGNMTVAFVRVPQGADFRPALQRAARRPVPVPALGLHPEGANPDAHARR